MHTQWQDLIEEARALGFPQIVGDRGAIEGEAGYMAAARGATTTAYIQQLRERLVEHASIAQRRAAEDQKWADWEAERSSTAPGPMDAIYAEQAEAARKAAEFRASVPGQLEALISINERILAVLEKRG
jgi:hypothetical protein